MIRAVEIADALGRPRPTDQQIAVIEAELSPAIVVAGAGSGKTETMANRVLWLLANGLVTADQVLGLTFTRKAAGELSARIRERITELSERGLIAGGFDPFTPPTVATYNAFANSIFRDNAMRLGRESDGAVLGEASAWQLARSVVVSSTDDRLVSLGRSVDNLTKDVLSLSRALSENVADPNEVRAMSERFSAIADLPAGGSGGYPGVDEIVRRVGALPVLVDLAARFAEAKARRGLVEYSDQVALALQIVRQLPAVVTEFKERFRVILLDEYQDTSVVQTWLLAELFADTAVMAVGDPNQSIYGWRGASAANLDGFARQFGRGAVQNFALTTSWRNGHRILAVANALVEPFVGTGGVKVERLIAGPAASDRKVEVVFAQTLPDEAEAVAVWLKTKLRVTGRATPPSAAILFRARSTQGVFIEALRRHEVPFHVLGVGGLLAEPEIADLVSALTVVNDPAAGSELVRLLAGAHWRVGVRDLRALRGVASWLVRHDYAQKVITSDLRVLMRKSVAEGESGSIVDALDFVATARNTHAALGEFSVSGLERLRVAGQTFALLRAHSGLELLDFVTYVERHLHLDIEVVANDIRSLGSANMDAFFDALTGYLALDDSASLDGFLAWLREAEWRDSLAPRPEEPEPGTVQLMTIHGAKGLERDLVVVPRLVEEELPGTPNEGSTGWLSWGALPFEFRGDAAELPVFEWDSATSRKEVLERKAEFAQEVRLRHDLEERRLAYVAVTRARHHLLLSGSFWSSQRKPRAPSIFLRELAAAGVLGELPLASEYAENPLGEDERTLRWPLDPLGGRRAAVEQAAERVRVALGNAHPAPDACGIWGGEIELLLEERRRRSTESDLVELPSRVKASEFKDYVSAPAAIAAKRRRPMPEKPYRQARLGTRFHSWVESRYRGGGAHDAIAGFEDFEDFSPLSARDALLGSALSDGDVLAQLRNTFELSRWASLAPIEVERSIDVPLAGQIIICKIDAVFFDGERYQVVDWKTGKLPRDAAGQESMGYQLALYRLAYAKWRGVDVDLVDAFLYFVSDDVEVPAPNIFDEAELVRRWNVALSGESPGGTRPVHSEVIRSS